MLQSYCPSWVFIAASATQGLHHNIARWGGRRKLKLSVHSAVGEGGLPCLPPTLYTLYPHIFSQGFTITLPPPPKNFLMWKHTCACTSHIPTDWVLSLAPAHPRKGIVAGSSFLGSNTSMFGIQQLFCQRNCNVDSPLECVEHLRQSQSPTPALGREVRSLPPGWPEWGQGVYDRVYQL